MADLLGSILGSMEKPPTAPESERKKAKAEEERIKKLQQQERSRKQQFQNYVERILSKFVKDSKTRAKLKPMNKIERTIVHEMAEEAGIISQAFGIEELDRHVMLFKKEHPPTEDEIDAYKNGQTWDETKAEECRKKKEILKKRLHEDENHNASDSSVPSSNYKDKYNHLIGTSAAKEAARRTEANKSFGMVPSHNKRDQRSIEETMNDIRAKKKQKTDSAKTSS